MEDSERERTWRQIKDRACPACHAQGRDTFINGDNALYHVCGKCGSSLIRNAVGEEWRVDDYSLPGDKAVPEPS